jgi:CO/xanthine dehydrogenase Mo-binding subunit
LIRWDEPRPQTEKKFRGVGIACAIHVSGSTTVTPQGAVGITRLYEDGTVHVANSEGDIGQGANTVMAQITSQELGIPVERIVVDRLDTDVTNFGVGAIGSRVTVLGGSAVRASAVAIRDRIIETVAKKWNCPKTEVNYAEGVVYHSIHEESMTLTEVASYYYDITGGSRIIGEALYTPQGVVAPDKTKYGNVSLGYSFCTHAVEVEIDRETGAVTVVDYVAVHDSGKIINPLTFEGQVQGAALMGIGWALGEEILFENGRVINPDFTNYRIPTAMDALKVRVVTLDIDDPNGPFGAKSIGEVAFDPIAPAVLNAICNASGFRFKTMPVNPERFYLAMKYQGRQRENQTFTDFGPLGMMACDR